MSDPFSTKHYVIGADEKEHQLFPMILADKDEIISCYKKILIGAPTILNLVSSKIDKDGNELLDENGSIIIDEEVSKAYLKIIEFATHETPKKFGKWVDVYVAEEIIEKYFDISRLKKNMTMGTIL